MLVSRSTWHMGEFFGDGLEGFQNGAKSHPWMRRVDLCSPTQPILRSIGWESFFFWCASLQNPWLTPAHSVRLGSEKNPRVRREAMAIENVENETGYLYGCRLLSASTCTVIY